MAVGVTTPSLSTFVTEPNKANAEVVRPAPTGYTTINETEFTLNGEVERVAYADLFSHALQGIYAYGFYDDYYNRIHIAPNPLNFGYIASPTNLSFYVWNTYLISQALEGVTPNNTGGLTISSGPMGQYTFISLEARTYKVWADTQGPGLVDASYSFAFTGLPVLVEKVKGTRVVVFPFQPNWATPVTERLEWMTTVLEMRDGSEQRLRNRQNPRQMLEYDFLVHHDEADLFSTLMFGWQGRAWGLPLWQHGQRIDSEFLVGTSTLACLTASYGYQVGGQVILYASSTHFEALTITAVTSNSIMTTTGTRNFWPAGTFIFPLRVSVLMGTPSIRKLTGAIGTGNVQFHSEYTLAVPSTWVNSYLNYPVLEIEPNRANPVTESWDRRVTTLDYGVGQSHVLDKHGFSRVTRSAQYLSINRDKIAELQNILNYAQGQWHSFWAPTFDSDLRLVGNTTINTALLVIAYVQYAKYLNNNSLRKHLRIQLRNGIIFYREVTGTDDVITPVGTETLTVDEVFPRSFTPADVYMISYMPLVRIGSDMVELGWTTMNIADTTLALKPILVPA